ncbi:helix-turn-helix transcriptional regulator [Cryptosporangium aurantiacum]|uniref:Helix-turn-helix domain-containing protein n=1 Tax=Cryptosporangium aurantiacum TaxID=134849 RepID=A0A1M7RG21_9ACTN|nr:helix-turn-helix transcriptional regulator [Cryptosporangium aurantiacum]SHN45235.1 Helix-turn-helix domain-containing protein [Cryptosporangium aurantiacum]
MDRRTEFGAYLRSRRARLRPQDVGLSEGIGNRRVPGLRREELALLAGVSVDYYVELEQGRAGAVSDVVLDAIARALRLDDAERAHLANLARPEPPARRRRVPRATVRPGLRLLLDTVDGHPAYIVGPRTEVLAWSPLAAALFTDFGALPAQQRYMARLVYLDESWQTLYVDWESKAADVVGFLRLQAGRLPDDPDLAALVGELSVKSDAFRTRWASQNVREKTFGTVALHHPAVGDLDLSWESLRSPTSDDQTLVVYSATPGTPTAERLRLLESWNAPAAAPQRTADRPTSTPQPSDPGRPR